MKKNLLLICFLLSACNLNNNFLYQDEYGRNIYQVDCGGMETSYVKCYQTINSVCKYGYDILKNEEQLTGTTTYGNIKNNTYNNGGANDVMYNALGTPYYMRSNTYANNQTVQTSQTTLNVYSRYIVYMCK